MDVRVVFILLIFTVSVAPRDRHFRRQAEPPSDWESGLREATHQALLRENYHTTGLHEHLLSAPIIGRKDTATPFGDIALLARGQLYANPQGFNFVQDTKCDGYSGCDFFHHAHHKLIALWTVKRIRHRHPHDGYVYEIEYTISPITSAINEDLVKRRGYFNYNVPGHIFVMKSNPESQKEYYEDHYHNGIVIGVGPHGYKNVLHSYPGFYTAYHPQGETTVDPKEYELYKKLIESLAAKTTPHRFKLIGNEVPEYIAPTLQNGFAPTPSQSTAIYFKVPQTSAATSTTIQKNIGTTALTQHTIFSAPSKTSILPQTSPAGIVTPPKLIFPETIQNTMFNRPPKTTIPTKVTYSTPTKTTITTRPTLHTKETTYDDKQSILSQSTGTLATFSDSATSKITIFPQEVPQVIATSGVPQVITIPMEIQKTPYSTFHTSFLIPTLQSTTLRNIETTEPEQYYKTLPSTTNAPTIELYPVTAPPPTTQYYTTPIKKTSKYSKKTPSYQQKSTNSITNQISVPPNTESTVPYVISTTQQTSKPSSSYFTTRAITITMPEITTTLPATTPSERSTTPIHEKIAVYELPVTSGTNIPTQTTFFYAGMPETTKMAPKVTTHYFYFDMSEANGTSIEVSTQKTVEPAVYTIAQPFLQATEQQQSTMKNQRNDYNDDDIFGKASESTMTVTTTKKPTSISELDEELFGTQQAQSAKIKEKPEKIIYNNFYTRGREVETTTKAMDYVSESYSTSISVEVNKKNETQLDETDSKLELHNAALQLVNHVRSIDYLSKKTTNMTERTTHKPKYRRKTYTAKIKRKLKTKST